MERGEQNVTLQIAGRQLQCRAAIELAGVHASRVALLLYRAKRDCFGRRAESLSRIIDAQRAVQAGIEHLRGAEPSRDLEVGS